MSDKGDQAKVEIKIGNVTFSGEGSQEWLDQQINKLLVAAASGSLGIVPAKGGEDRGSGEDLSQSISLASYLKAKGADNKQVDRFLTTAAWLVKRGEKTLSTAAIAKTLANNHQKKLANPADCLNKNVNKGYCEKNKDGFFVTSEGWKHLGEER